MAKSLSFKIASVHLLLCLFLSPLRCLAETTSSATTNMVTTSTAMVTTATTKITTLESTTITITLENVENVTVLRQNETSITLKWEKVDNIQTYRLQYNDNGNITVEIISESNGTSVEYVVSPLTAGTKYDFILFTVLDDDNSTGHPFTAVTAPENVVNVTVLRQNETSITLKWEKVNNIQTYRLQYNDNGNITVENISESNGTSVEYVVSPLTAGTEYDFTLFTVFYNVPSSGRNISAVTDLGNVKNVAVLRRNETSITLKWEKVNNIQTYRLQYNHNGNITVEIISESNGTSVEYVVSPLTAGTKYDFILFTVLDDDNSTGYPFTAVTAPENVENVTVLRQNENSITLKWEKVDNIQTYRLQYNDNGNITVENIIESNGTSVEYVVSFLTAGTKYDFTLFTVFEDANSNGHPFTAVTAPENVKNVTVLRQNETSITLKWEKVNNIQTYMLQYNDNGNITVENISESNGTSVEYVVSPLTAGTKYDFTLFTVFYNVPSSGQNISAVTVPGNVKNVTVLRQNETSITLKWETVNNIQTYRLQYNHNGNITVEIISESNGTSVEYVVSPLTAGTKYDFILFTVLDDDNSTGHPFTAVTAPENVENVTVLRQNETSITLKWEKVNNIETYRLQYNDNGNITVENISESNGTSVEYVVSPLTAGTEYDFTLFTVFYNVPSSGRNISAVTDLGNVKSVAVLRRNETSITLKWEKVNNIQTYRLQYNHNGNITVEIISESNGTSVEYVVSPLTAATKYDFILFTVLDDDNSTGYPFTAITAPENVKNVIVLRENETSITLKWEKLNNMQTYRLQYNDNGNITVENIIESNGTQSVEYVVSPLTAGTKYDFTLFAVFYDVPSSGRNISAVTAPLNVDGVIMAERSLTSVTLQWNKVHEAYKYLLRIDTDRWEDILVPPTSSSDHVTHSVSRLHAGTEYSFTLFSVFHGVRSSGFAGVIVTAIDCTTSPWDVTNSSIKGKIEGLFSEARATNGSNRTHVSPGGGDVSFTGLYPGSTYEVSLWYRLDSEDLQQCIRTLTIIPADLKARCDDWAAAYSISIRWDEPEGVWTHVEVNVAGKTYNVSSMETQISGFQPAKKYEVSVALHSGPSRTKPYILNCSTDPRGVIAGAVLAVLLFGILVFLALFIYRRRPDIFSRKNPFIIESKPAIKLTVIPAGMFPDHFNQMSADDNRGFSEEYESFIPVGTEQTRKAAVLPDNKAKNRFTNVLPYDWSRVKLTTLRGDENSDYINANYMPGCNSNRQYIAAQGPLPSTVNDFWCLIWEQSVKGVVMVTNCTEGGRVKCEQYWPLDYTPCRYGDLLVTIISEQPEPNWTLREFAMKNKQTGEERAVKHFHFTAWPDHGVPDGTEALIQFRGLVREHIENEGGRTPTLVHCSAGVGRTGTIIALDVLLQQLQGEKEVGIAAFVHKMRLSRPLMVQTESQYVFLHQCIMNTLQKDLDNEENIYENSDMIYANATALREFRSRANT